MKRDLAVQTRAKTEFLEITMFINEALMEAGVVDGVVHIGALHTSCAIVLNENADQGLIWRDLFELLDTLAPADGSYHHGDGNAQAHLKAMLLGSEKTVPVRNGQLALGVWQGIYLAEFDGPRERKIVLTLLEEAP